MRGLFEGLSKEFPDERYVLSTVTPTGNSIAARIARPQDVVTYLPLDISAIVNRVVGFFKPRLFIIAETEFWPNMLSTLHRKGIPVVIVNGRISERAARGYRMAHWLLAPILKKISIFACNHSMTQTL